MAIYHLSTKPISRSSGRTATASIAYRAGIAIQDERTGKKHDYTKRSGVVSTQLHTPNNLKIERNELWNLAEKTETRKNSRTAREIVVNLPHELSEQSRERLVNDFAQDLSDKYGVAVDVAIHTPDKQGDNRNHHAHLMLTTRKLERLESGRITLTSKSQLEMSNTQLKERGLRSAKEELKLIREQWANIANERLEKAGLDVRIDHRSHEDRGLILKPTKKLGWEATALERKGIATETGNYNRQVKAFNQSVKEIVSLNRQLKQVNIKEQANEQTKERTEQISARLDRQTSVSSHTNERGRELQTASSSKSNELGQTYTSQVGRSDKAVTITSLRDRQPRNQGANKQSEVTAVTEPKTRPTAKEPPVIEGQTVEEAQEVLSMYDKLVAVTSEKMREHYTKQADAKMTDLAKQYRDLEANMPLFLKGKHKEKMQDVARQHKEAKMNKKYYQERDYTMDAKGYIEKKYPDTQAKREQASDTLHAQASFKYGSMEAQAGRTYTGEITAVTRLGIKQELATGKTIYHELGSFEHLPQEGDKLTIRYDTDQKAHLMQANKAELERQELEAKMNKKYEQENDRGFER